MIWHSTGSGQTHYVSYPENIKIGDLLSYKPPRKKAINYLIHFLAKKPTDIFI